MPVEVPALTVNRLCGSGLQAAVSGAQLIQLGEASIVLTGGVERVSQAPHVIRGARWGIPLGKGQLEDSLWSALTWLLIALGFGTLALGCVAFLVWSWRAGSWPFETKQRAGAERA